MDLRQFADTYGGVPLFILLSYYFATIKKPNYLELFLFIACFTAMFVDVYLSFVY